MFAVVKTGAKQYKVAAGDIIKVERLSGEAGEKISLDHILMVGNEEEIKIGTPTVVGMVVTAEILEQSRAAKIIIFKKKRRQNYRRKNGHRQQQTVLRIVEVGPVAAKKTPVEKVKKAASENIEKPEKIEKTEGKPAISKVAVKKATPKKTAANKTEEK